MIENAIIIAAGTSSRFVPLSYEKHKALTVVKGEVMIERLIRQLRSAGIEEIYIVTGYKAEQFLYLKNQFDVQLIVNTEYRKRNNNSSIWAARDVLKNSLIIASDLYFTKNPFEKESSESYYAAEYAKGYTKEWCLREGQDGFIDQVTIGGENSWYMADHAFWSEDFCRQFIRLLSAEYNRKETAGKLWETIYMEHLDLLKMRIKKYAPGTVYEFDSLDSLREYDESYQGDSRSVILKRIAEDLGAKESELNAFTPVVGADAQAQAFTFHYRGKEYQYNFKEERMV